MPGLYLCMFTVCWASAAGGGRRIVSVGTAQNVAAQAKDTSTAAGLTTAALLNQSAAIPFLQGGPGGRLCCNVFQDSGASISITDARMTIVRLGTYA